MVLVKKGESKTVTKNDIANRMMDMSLYTKAPMQPALSGLQTEYFIIQLYSRNAGKRAARFSFNCGQVTQDIGFRNEADILFNCLFSRKIKLQVLDENTKPTRASFIIKDKQNHIYPSQMKRLAPDFFFQPQVYRSNGETIALPAGDYVIEYGRGHGYLTKKINFAVTVNINQSLKINLQRWIDPSKFGYYSGFPSGHIIDFKVNDVEMGSQKDLNLNRPSKVIVTEKVAACLNKAIDTSVKKLDLFGNVWEQKPFWNIERGRIGNTKMVAVELIINGNTVASQNILADGNLQNISFETVIDKSSWVALRIKPSSHTNPIFVLVNEKLIRASKQSAEWCLKAVDRCWNQKSGKFADTEKEEAAKVYEAAREAYQKIISKSVE